jgi:hypothetical protein
MIDVAVNLIVFGVAVLPSGGTFPYGLLFLDDSLYLSNDIHKNFRLMLERFEKEKIDYPLMSVRCPSAWCRNFFFAELRLAAGVSFAKVFQFSLRKIDTTIHC